MVNKKRLKLGLKYQDSHKVLQYQCMADEATQVCVCWYKQGSLLKMLHTHGGGITRKVGKRQVWPVRMTSSRQRRQQDIQHDCTSDLPPLACCPGYFSSPFPCVQNRV
jgi:hypothetical protein